MNNLMAKARSEFNGFAGKDCQLYWSIGVLENWSVGKTENANFKLSSPFITPLLHHSITPVDHLIRVKRN